MRGKLFAWIFVEVKMGIWASLILAVGFAFFLIGIDEAVSSFLPAIILAGIPDRLADKEVSKKVVAVLWGPRKAVLMAVFFACLASFSAFLLWDLRILREPSGELILIAIPHAFVLTLALFKLIQSHDYDRRIDGIMALALSFIIWFGLIPLISFL